MWERTNHVYYLLSNIWKEIVAAVKFYTHNLFFQPMRDKNENHEKCCISPYCHIKFKQIVEFVTATMYLTDVFTRSGCSKSWEIKIRAKRKGLCFIIHKNIIEFLTTTGWLKYVHSKYILNCKGQNNTK